MGHLIACVILSHSEIATCGDRDKMISVENDLGRDDSLMKMRVINSTESLNSTFLNCYDVDDIYRAFRIITANPFLQSRPTSKRCIAYKWIMNWWYAGTTYVMIGKNIRVTFHRELFRWSIIWPCYERCRRLRGTRPGLRFVLIRFPGKETMTGTSQNNRVKSLSLTPALGPGKPAVAEGISCKVQGCSERGFYDAALGAVDVANAQIICSPITSPFVQLALWKNRVWKNVIENTRATAWEDAPMKLS